jgi:hypothetical protein
MLPMPRGTQAKVAVPLKATLEESNNFFFFLDFWLREGEDM